MNRKSSHRSPQCSPSAILHLYQSTSSTHLVYHPKYSQLTQDVLKSHPETRLISLPESSKSHGDEELPILSLNPSFVSHVFHTSGTSGTPKPIPNTHKGSMSVLPRRAIPSYLPSSASQTSSLAPSGSAAFTTTPLFHGGVSDLLRAWMARSMIYFYPTSDVSITTQNVVASVLSCQTPSDHLDGIDTEVEERENRFKVTAFLSVPYILSVLAEDLQGPGIEMLRGMRFVSTGGAPLDTAIGDAMVKEGVRLVSRLGSSECGCESAFAITLQSRTWLINLQFSLALIEITKRRKTGSFCGMIVRTGMPSSLNRRPNVVPPVQRDSK